MRPQALDHFASFANHRFLTSATLGFDLLLRLSLIIDHMRDRGRLLNIVYYVEQLLTLIMQ